MKDNKIERKEFLNSIRNIAKYWGSVSNTTQKAAEGTAFSIMCLLDGVSTDNLCGYEIIDKETGVVINDKGELHSEL